MQYNLLARLIVSMRSTWPSHLYVKHNDTIIHSPTRRRVRRTTKNVIFFSTFRKLENFLMLTPPVCLTDFPIICVVGVITKPGGTRLPLAQVSQKLHVLKPIVLKTTYVQHISWPFLLFFPFFCHFR